MSAPTAAAVSAPAVVDIEIPGFADHALSEQGHWLDCGLVAEIQALAFCTWEHMNSWASDALRSALIARFHAEYLAAINPSTGHPRMDHGTELSDIHWHLTVKHPEFNHLAGYIATADAPNYDQLHAFVKAHCVRRNPIIAFVTRAYQLTKAEPGVNGHFVCLGGIHSDKGYLTANGDTLDGLKSAPGALIPTQWNTWAQLQAAHINGAIALDRSWTPPPPPDPTPTPDPAPTSTPAAPTADDVITAVTAAVRQVYHL